MQNGNETPEQVLNFNTPVLSVCKDVGQNVCRDTRLIGFYTFLGSDTSLAGLSGMCAKQQKTFLTALINRSYYTIVLLNSPC